MSDKKILRDALNRLIPAQFEEVLFNYGVPATAVPPKGTLPFFKAFYGLFHCKGSVSFSKPNLLNHKKTQ